MSGECVKKYLMRTFPGLYHLLCIAGVDFSELIVNKSKAHSIVKKLYGDEAAEFLLKLLEEACVKED